MDARETYNRYCRLVGEGEYLCGNLAIAYAAETDPERRHRIDRLWMRAANRTARRMMGRDRAAKALPEVTL